MNELLDRLGEGVVEQSARLTAGEVDVRSGRTGRSGTVGRRLTVEVLVAVEVLDAAAARAGTAIWPRAVAAGGGRVARGPNWAQRDAAMTTTYAMPC
jgi:hypothetical protein